MAFFDPDISNGMQFVTLPAEIVGITLAFIEFRFPQLSQSLNIKVWAISGDGILSTTSKIIFT